MLAEKKNPLLSTTIIGALMVMATTIANYFGFSIGEAPELTNAIITLVGAVMAIIGRIRAKKGIALPKLPGSN